MKTASRSALRPFSKVIALLVLVSVAMTSFSTDAEAARRRRKKKKTKQRQQVINEPKLYERMGGSKAVAEIVDEWMRLSFADTRTASSFKDVTLKPERIARMRKNLSDHLCELADGPCAEKPIDPAKAPEGMLLPDDVFLAYSDNLLKSLQKQGLSEREKNEMLGRLGDYRSDLTSDSSAN